MLVMLYCVKRISFKNNPKLHLKQIACKSLAFPIRINPNSKNRLVLKIAKYKLFGTVSFKEIKRFLAIFGKKAGFLCTDMGNLIRTLIVLWDSTMRVRIMRARVRLPMSVLFLLFPKKAKKGHVLFCKKYYKIAKHCTILIKLKVPNRQDFVIFKTLRFFEFG